MDGACGHRATPWGCLWWSLSGCALVGYYLPSSFAWHCSLVKIRTLWAFVQLCCLRGCLAGQQAALANASGNTYNLDSPALCQAIPLACFVLACKHVETWLPGRNLADVANLDSAFNAHCPCASKDVHDAELWVLYTLDWNIDPLSAIDVAEELVYMAPLTGPVCQHAELRKQISRELHLNLIIAALCKNLCRETPARIATACLLDACQRTGISAELVPLFLQPTSSEVLAIRCAISAFRPHVSPVLLEWLSMPSE